MDAAIVKRTEAYQLDRKFAPKQLVFTCTFYEMKMSMKKGVEVYNPNQVYAFTVMAPQLVL